MEEYLLPIGVDAEKLLGPLNESIALLDKLGSTATETSKETATAARTAAAAQESLTEAVTQTAAAYQESEAAVSAITKEIKKFQDAAAAASKNKDPLGVVTAIKQVRELEKQLAAVQAQQKKNDETAKASANTLVQYAGNFGKAYDVLAKRLQEVKALLSNLSPDDSAFADLQREEGLLTQLTENLNKTFGSTRQEMRALQETATRLGLTIGTDSEAFRNFSSEVGTAIDETDDLRDILRREADAQSFIDQAVEGAGELAAGYGVAAGALQLFGVDSETAQDSMNKLIAIQTISNGLWQIQESLKRRDGIASLIAAAAQKVYTVAVGESSGAMRLFRTALLATGIGALVIGLGLLIANFDDVKEAVLNFVGVSVEANKQNKLTQELANKAAESYSDEVGKLRALTIEYGANTTSRERQAAIIRQLRADNPKYYDGLRAEGELLENVTAATNRAVAAKKLMAEANAALQLYTERQKALLVEENKSMEDNINVFEATFNLLKAGGKASTAAIYNVNTALSNTADNTKKLREESERFLNSYIKKSGEAERAGLNNPAAQAAALADAKKASDARLAQLQADEIAGNRISKAALDEALRNRYLAGEAEKADEKKTAPDRVLIDAQTNKDIIGMRKDYNDKIRERNAERIRGEQDSAAKVKEINAQIEAARTTVLKDGIQKEKQAIRERYAAQVEGIQKEAQAENTRLRFAEPGTISATERNNIVKAQQARKELVLALKAQQEKEERDADINYALEVAEFQNTYQKALLDSQQESTEKSVALTRLEADERLIAARAAYKDFPAKYAEIEKAIVAQRERIIKETIQKSQQDEIQLREDAALKTVDIITAGYDNQAQIAAVKQRAQVNLEARYAKERLSALVRQTETEGKIIEGAIAEQFSNKKLAAAAGAGVDIFTFLGIDFKGTPEQIEAAKVAMLDAIQKIKAGVVQASKDDKTDIFGAIFGINKGSYDNNKQQYEKYVDSTRQALTAITDAYATYLQTQANQQQQEIDALTAQIDTAQSELDRELDLRKEGYANNADAKAKEVEQLKQKRQEDIDNQKRIQKEQAELAVAQQAIALAVSVAKMIEAVAQIIESGSEQGGYIGAIAAAVAAAGVVAEFVSLKSSIKQAQSLGKGGRAGGQLHTEGGNKYVSMDGNDPEIIEIERDEWVINRKSSEKYNELLEAINRDSVADMLRGMGIHLPDEYKRETMQDYRAAEDVKHTFLTANFSHLDTATLKQIAENTAAMAKAQKDAPVTYIDGDYRVTERPGHIRRTKITKHD